MRGRPAEDPVLGPAVPASARGARHTDSGCITHITQITPSPPPTPPEDWGRGEKERAIGGHVCPGGEKPENQTENQTLWIRCLDPMDSNGGKPALWIPPSGFDLPLVSVCPILTRTFQQVPKTIDLALDESLVIG